MMNFRSSTSATASACAKETNALTASKTVVRPSNAACAVSFALRWSDSDARRSINVRSMAKKYMRPDCGGVRANIH
jgi:hypothetical protein